MIFWRHTASIFLASDGINLLALEKAPMSLQVYILERQNVLIKLRDGED